MVDKHSTPGPSLFQAQVVHRSHRDNHHRYKHESLHRREIITETDNVVTATVSVIQQIQVDSSGSTITVVTYTSIPGEPKVPTPSVPVPVQPAPSTTPIAPIPTTSTPPAAVIPPSTTPTAGSIQSTVPPSVLSQTPPQTTANTPSLQSSSGNSSAVTISTTTSISSTATLSSNVTLSAARTSHKSETDSSRHTTLYYSTSTITGDASISSPYTRYTTDASGHSIVIIGGGSAASATSSSSATSSAGAGSGNNTNNSTPTTPVLVGGIVGGLAGATFFVVILLFLLRWRKQKYGYVFGSGPSSGTRAIASRDISDPPSSGGMTQSSMPFAISAALAALTGRKQRSAPADATSSTAGSERGFYRVSGRKLPSVLQSGGDGYGGGFGEAPMPRNPDTLGDTSFYRDSQGFHGGTGVREDGGDIGMPIMRPSPARTPVQRDAPFGGHTPISPFETPPLPPPIRSDRLGRSHPSQDGSRGSRGSRFTEEIV